MRVRSTLMAVSSCGLLAATAAMAAEAPVTADEIATFCARVSHCAPAAEPSDAFCSGQADIKKLEAAAIPTAADVRASRKDCDLIVPAGLPANVLGDLSIDQNALLWGSADFLLRRADQELHVWAIDNFLESICDKGAKAKLGDEPLFPSSCAVLSDLQLEGLMGGMTAFQAAARDDLSAMPFAYLKYLETQTSDPKFKDAALAAAQASLIVRGLSEGQTALTSLRSIATMNRNLGLSCTKHPAASATFQVLAAISSLSLDPAGDIKMPRTDQERNQVLMAVAVNGSDPKVMQAQFPSDCRTGAIGAPFKPADLLAAVKSLDLSLGGVKTAIAAMKALPPTADRGQKAAALGRVMEKLVGTIDVALQEFPNDAVRGTEVRMVTAAVRRIAYDVGSANYGMLVGDLGVAATALALKTTLPKHFTRIASFGAEVATASTSEAAMAGIDRFAAPLGSYRLKRHADGLYGRLNGYFGAAVMGERAQSAPNQWKDGTTAFAPGFWAPIGIELGFGGSPDGWSFGLFLQGVDLGLLASWRVTTSKDDQAAAPPTVGIEQVFSPGAFLMVGLPDAPISLGLGGSLALKLRSLDTMEESKLDAFRFGLAIGVDIPIFP